MQELIGGHSDFAKRPARKYTDHPVAILTSIFRHLFHPAVSRAVIQLPCIRSRKSGPTAAVGVTPSRRRNSAASGLQSARLCLNGGEPNELDYVFLMFCFPKHFPGKSGTHRKRIQAGFVKMPASETIQSGSNIGRIRVLKPFVDFRFGCDQLKRLFIIANRRVEIRLKFFYTDHFELPLPAKHRFPMSKYRRLREHVAEKGIANSDELQVPDAASDTELLRCHDCAYVSRVQEGTLTDAEIKRIGFPWSEKMVERSRRSTGATIAAARAAMNERCAVNLAGGTHHAFRDAGEGYCVFNDTACAAKAMQAEERIKRAVILDCDVHQGNGTAAILKDDPSVFTMSIHGARNFPLRKVDSDLDVPLDDGTDDREYLARLEPAIEESLSRADADLAFYLAGADPYEGDRLGRLAVTKAGLLERDRLVLSSCKEAGLRVVVVMAGGYAESIDDLVEIHAGTIEVAANLFR